MKSKLNTPSSTFPFSVANVIALLLCGFANPSAIAGKSTPAAASGPAWSSVAVGGGGFVIGLAASTTGTAIYARTDVGGAYRWDAAGTQWLPITDSLPNDSGNVGHAYGIDSLAVDPNNAKRVFISSGKYSYSNPSGIYVTNDASVTNPTWTSIDPAIRVIANGGLRDRGERLAVDPYNSNVVYFGTYNISNGGSGLKKYCFDTTWHTSTLETPAVGSVNAGITFVAADKNGGSVSDGTRKVAKYIYIGVYSGSAGNGGVFATSDGGASWTKTSEAPLDKPSRGEVAADGTLYVTHGGGVAKLARGATTLAAIAPVPNVGYIGLAVDPSAAGTVMVADSSRLWRSIDSGTTWVLVARTIHNTEPDGTPSVTGKGGFDHVSDLLINPADRNEVWVSDFLGVQRTQNIKDNAAPSDWYHLQKNHEEVCVLDLTSAPSGAPLLSGVADVNGFVHNDPSVRPTGADHFDGPGYISTTSMDYSAGTSGSNTVWARVGDMFYHTGTDSDKTGGFSTNDGRDWVPFGVLDGKYVRNSATAGWETFDVGPYLKQQRAAGIKEVTLCVRAITFQTNKEFLHFSSKEGANAPQLLVNGTTALPPTADATVFKGAPKENNGKHAELQTQNYFEQAGYNKRFYLKFDLSNFSSVNTASLRLYRLAVTGSTAFNTSIYATPTTDWVEGDGGSDNTPEREITWGNMPVNFRTPPGGAQGGHIAVSSSDPDKFVWACENGNVYYTKDRGVIWARAMSGTNGMWVGMTTEFQMHRSQLAADRVTADTFYVYSPLGGGTVFHSTDGGANWSVLASSIGDVDTRSYPCGYKLETVPGMSGAFWFCAQNTNVAVHFKYWNGTSMVPVPGISNVVDFAFGKAAPKQNNATVYVRKADGTHWYSTDATAGGSTWTQIAVPTLNDQPCVMEGDLQKYGRIYVGTNGRGIFFTDVP